MAYAMNVLCLDTCYMCSFASWYFRENWEYDSLIPSNFTTRKCLLANQGDCAPAHCEKFQKTYLLASTKLRDPAGTQPFSPESRVRAITGVET